VLVDRHLSQAWPASAFAQGTVIPRAATGASGLRSRKGGFELMEATIADIHDAYRRGRLTCRELVQQYLDRSEVESDSGRPPESGGG
jgi:hypothetical protein